MERLHHVARAGAVVHATALHPVARISAVSHARAADAADAAGVIAQSGVARIELEGVESAAGLLTLAVVAAAARIGWRHTRRWGAVSQGCGVTS